MISQTVNITLKANKCPGSYFVLEEGTSPSLIGMCPVCGCAVKVFADPEANILLPLHDSEGAPINA